MKVKENTASKAPLVAGFGVAMQSVGASLALVGLPRGHSGRQDLGPGRPWLWSSGASLVCDMVDPY